MCLLVDADVRVEPPALALLVDLALADDEAGVQPAVPLRIRREFHAGEDRAVGSVSGLDALPVYRHDELVPIGSSDHPAQVRRPHAVLAPAWIVRPDEAALDRTHDRAITVTEAQPFFVAVRSMPARVGVLHRQPAQRLEAHGRIMPRPRRR
jgi:hypothetical protein